MQGIYTFEKGLKVPATVNRMFASHGPYLLNGKRLDMLCDLQILVDASTFTRMEVGQMTTESGTGNVLTRAAIGGLVAGGAGAVIGGTTGRKNSTIESSTTEVRNTELTLALTFRDNTKQNIVVTDLGTYHHLLELVNGEPFTDEELVEEKKAAEIFEVDQARAHRRETFMAHLDRTMAPPFSEADIRRDHMNIGGFIGGFCVLLHNLDGGDHGPIFFIFFALVYAVIGMFLGAFLAEISIKRRSGALTEEWAEFNRRREQAADEHEKEFSKANGL